MGLWNTNSVVQFIFSSGHLLFHFPLLSPHLRCPSFQQHNIDYSKHTLLYLSLPHEISWLWGCILKVYKMHPRVYIPCIHSLHTVPAYIPWILFNSEFVKRKTLATSWQVLVLTYPSQYDLTLLHLSLPCQSNSKSNQITDHNTFAEFKGFMDSQSS